MNKPCLIFAAITILNIPICSGQTSTVGKIDNSGTCSFTSINASNSTFKILCGGKGISPEDANKLSQIFSIVTRNKLQMSEVLKNLQILADQSKVQSVQQSCPDGFCNSGTVQAPQTVNDNRQFRAPAPAPEIGFSSSALPAIQRPVRTPEMTDAEYQRKVAYFEDRLNHYPYDSHPGVQISLGVSRTFLNPAFLVRCQRPCAPSFMAIQRGNFESSFSGLSSRNQMLRSDDPRVAIFILGDQSRLLRTEAVRVIVRSTSSEEVGSVMVEGYVE